MIEKTIYELNKMYDGFYSNNGECKFFAECGKNMSEYGCRFCKIKVGKEYGNNSMPKLMFIGKEGVSNSDGIQNPAKVSEVTNPHFLKTIYSTLLLMEGKDLDINKNTINATYDYISDYFCLTNYFKCAFTDSNENRHHLHTNINMSKNCNRILLEEIKILKPNVIVVQGKFSHSSFYNKNGLLKFCTHIKQIYKSKDYNISLNQYIYNDNGEELYVLWGYHPCANGDLWSKSLNSYKEALKLIPNTNYFKRELL